MAGKAFYACSQSIVKECQRKMLLSFVVYRSCGWEFCTCLGLRNPKAGDLGVFGPELVDQDPVRLPRKGLPSPVIPCS